MNFRCFKTKFEANKTTQENAFIIYLFKNFFGFENLWGFETPLNSLVAMA